jgi:hypothetical protein
LDDDLAWAFCSTLMSGSLWAIRVIFAMGPLFPLYPRTRTFAVHSLMSEPIADIAELREEKRLTRPLQG